MLGGKSWDEWIGQYGRSHQHPFNRLCHTVGIPLIVVSLPLLLAAERRRPLQQHAHRRNGEYSYGRGDRQRGRRRLRGENQEPADYGRKNLRGAPRR